MMMMMKFRNISHMTTMEINVFTLLSSLYYYATMNILLCIAMLTAYITYSFSL